MKEMDRPQLGPMGMADDTAWTGIDPRHERRERN
jgi:hypothetical protein